MLAEPDLGSTRSAAEEMGDPSAGRSDPLFAVGHDDLPVLVLRIYRNHHGDIVVEVDLHLTGGFQADFFDLSVEQPKRLADFGRIVAGRHSGGVFSATEAER